MEAFMKIKLLKQFCENIIVKDPLDDYCVKNIISPVNKRVNLILNTCNFVSA